MALRHLPSASFLCQHPFSISRVCALSLKRDRACLWFLLRMNTYFSVSNEDLNSLYVLSFGSCIISVCHFSVNESCSLILIWLVRLLISEVVNQFKMKKWDSSHLSSIYEILSSHVGKPNSLRLSSFLHAIFGRLPLGFDINLHQNFTAFIWSLIYGGSNINILFQLIFTCANIFCTVPVKSGDAFVIP